MLSIELAEFYGVKDAALCSDFVNYLNVMVGLAEANRRECWSALCLGMLNVQTRNSELEGKLKEMKQKNEVDGEKYLQAVGLSERLNGQNRELKGEIETLKAQLSDVPKPPEEGAKQLVQVGPGKPRTNHAAAKRSINTIVPDSDEEQPPRKKDSSEVVIGLRNKIASLLSENERLNRLFASLKVEVVPPTDNGRGRVNLEEVKGLRKVNAELEAKLVSVTEEARLQAHEHAEEVRRLASEHSESMKENNAAWHREKLEWAKQHESREGQQQILIPSAFSLSCGDVMVCPVPIRTGRLMPLIEIYYSWIRYPGDNEGTFFTSFMCPYTTQLTSLGSAEEVLLLHNIAGELRLFVVPPLRFQYFLNGNWMDFTIVDQIAIAAMCCKHYRLATSRAVENVLVCHGDYFFKLHITDNVVDFQMQPVYNPNKTSPACLTEMVAGFFQRWTFPTGGERASDGAADQ